jgi:hypothetical protein
MSNVEACTEVCSGLGEIEAAICFNICQAFLPGIQERAATVATIVQENVESLVIREYIIEGVLIFIVFFLLVVVLLYKRCITPVQAILVTILAIVVIAVIQTYRVFDVLNALQTTSNQVLASLP